MRLTETQLRGLLQRNPELSITPKRSTTPKQSIGKDVSAEFWLAGAVPVKKNGKMLIASKGHRPRLITDPAKQSEIKALEFLARSVWRNRPPLTQATVSMTFHVAHRRKDPDGVQTTILDVLVAAGILQNDSMAHIDILGPVKWVLVSPEEEGVIVQVSGKECLV